MLWRGAGGAVYIKDMRTSAAVEPVRAEVSQSADSSQILHLAAHLAAWTSSHATYKSLTVRLYTTCIRHLSTCFMMIFPDDPIVGLLHTYNACWLDQGIRKCQQSNVLKFDLLIGKNQLFYVTEDENTSLDKLKED